MCLVVADTKQVSHYECASPPHVEIVCPYAGAVCRPLQHMVTVPAINVPQHLERLGISSIDLLKIDVSAHSPVSLLAAQPPLTRGPRSLARSAKGARCLSSRALPRASGSLTRLLCGMSALKSSATVASCPAPHIPDSLLPTQLISQSTTQRPPGEDSEPFLPDLSCTV